MSLKENLDYVFTSRSTTIQLGVVNCALVGTKEKLFFVPQNSISGGGTTVTSTKYSIGEYDVVSGVQALLQDPEQSLASLEATLRKYYQDWGLEADKYIIEIPKLKSFKIKTGFFTKGGYLKYHDRMMPQTFSLNGKGIAQTFAEFYQGISI
jgi:hypothetical protein